MKKLVLILFFALWSCGASSDTNNSGDINNSSVLDGFDSNKGETGFVEQIEENKDMNSQQTDSSKSYVLEFVGMEASIDAYPNKEYPVGIRIYDSENYEPAIGKEVTFSIDGDCATINGNAKVVTDDQGMASSSIVTSDKVGATCKIIASCAIAPSVFVKITIKDIPKGNMIITPQLLFEVDSSSTLKLTVIRGTYICGNFSPVQDPPADLIVASQTKATTEAEIKFENLDQGSGYTVTGLVYDSDNHLTGSGCIDNLSIYPNQDTTYPIKLSKLNLILQGNYFYNSTFAADSFVPEQIYSLQQHTDSIFNGSDLSDLFKQKLTEKFYDHLPPGASKEPCQEKVDADIESIVPSHISALTIPQFKDFKPLVKKLLSQLEIKGNIKVKNYVSDANPYFLCDLTVKSIGFKSCEQAKCSFTSEELSKTMFSFKLIEPFEIKLHISDYNLVKSDTFSLPIDGGRLAMLIFNELVLKEQTGENQLYDYIIESFKCSDLGYAFSEDVMTCTKLAPEDIEDMCKKIVTEHVKQFTTWLSPLGGANSIDFTLSMTGVDTDQDIVLDSATGTMEVKGKGQGVDTIQGTVEINSK